MTTRNPIDDAQLALAAARDCDELELRTTYAAHARALIAATTESEHR